MRELIFESVADVNCTYPYLLVYFQENTDPLLSPFMEISITEEKQLELKIFGQPYASKFDVVLTIDQWKTILSKAEEYFPKALANEESFQSWYREPSHIEQDKPS
jgi:hypothetical protein